MVANDYEKLGIFDQYDEINYLMSKRKEVEPAVSENDLARMKIRRYFGCSRMFPPKPHIDTTGQLL